MTRYLQKHLRQEVHSVSPPRQGYLAWDKPNPQQLSQAAQARCRELLSQMLLGTVSGSTHPEQESDEREDSSHSH
jgi:hypothetical protein